MSFGSHSWIRELFVPLHSTLDHRHFDMVSGFPALERFDVGWREHTSNTKLPCQSGVERHGDGDLLDMARNQNSRLSRARWMRKDLHVKGRMRERRIQRTQQVACFMPRSNSRTAG